MEEYRNWARGCVGRTEQEVITAIVDGGGEARVVERDGASAASASPSKLTICASLTVAGGLVTEIAFA